MASVIAFLNGTSMSCSDPSSATMCCHSFSGACCKTQQLALWLPALGFAWGSRWVSSCLPRRSCYFMAQSLIPSPNAMPSLLQTWSPCSEGNLLFLWKTNLKVIWWHAMNIHAYGLCHMISCWAMRRKCPQIKFWRMHDFCGKCDYSWMWCANIVCVHHNYFSRVVC